MPWPTWLSKSPPSSSDDKKREASTQQAEPPPQKAGSWEKSLNGTDWSHYTSPQTIIASVVTTATTLALIRVYKTYMRRIPNVEYLKPGLFRKRTIYGIVTRVGDGDNFHLFHTPGGRLMGWDWLPWRRIARARKLKDKTVHVRIAGVDAPELSHFGRPAQPYGQEALDWLSSSLLNQYVRAYPYRRDQYDRVVCTVYQRKWLFFRTDIGLNMIKRGLATVYEAKFGSEFGNKEQQYRAAEAQAKQRKLGMWQEPSLVGRMLGHTSKVESPREYKTRIANGEKSHTKQAAK